MELLDDIDDSDIDAMVEALDQMFTMMVSLTQLKANLAKLEVPQTKSKVVPVTKRAKSDDEVLAKFIQSLM